METENMNIKKKLDSSINEILLKYSNLIEEYIEYFKKNIKITNKNHKNFIFNKGLNCIIIIYSILLIHTNNLNIVYSNTKKGFYYYIEFIEQTLSNKNLNLNLTSQDAILFVYKKTIYDFNLTTNVSKNHNKLKTLLQLYNFILTENIDYNTLYISKNTFDTLNELFSNICKIRSIKKITTVCNYLTFEKNDLLNKLQYVNQLGINN
jgi:hypothetical protein|tara:strand:+ start:96 stop:716 length:621 start_codon:yes stop_codon:yes gene_type:complete